MPLKIYSVGRAWNPRSVMAEIMAALCDVELEHVSFEMGKDETPDYLRNCHPLGRSPVLETPDGYIFESGAIARYFARISPTPLYGSTAFEASCCDMWVDYAINELSSHVFVLVRNILFKVSCDKECVLNELKASLDGLEQWLENRTYLVGERMSVGDVAVSTSIWAMLQWIVEADAMVKSHRNCYRLYNTVMQEPRVVEKLRSIGTSFLPAVFPKVEKPKEEKPKEEKPKAAKPADEDAGDDEDDVPKEKKKPNPLDALPPSPFVLDAFKREYSNTDTRTVASPYFFTNFDAAGFSCFWCKYLYNDELKKPFMTANLVRGWFQRMEHLRKYAFGVALIVGEEAKHEIRGLWVFRGKGMPECVKEVEDTELFSWTEIADIQAEKANITDYLCWEGPTIGLPVIEGRVFK